MSPKPVSYSPTPFFIPKRNPFFCLKLLLYDITRVVNDWSSLCLLLLLLFIFSERFWVPFCKRTKDNIPPLNRWNWFRIPILPNWLHLIVMIQWTYFLYPLCSPNCRTRDRNRAFVCLLLCCSLLNVSCTTYAQRLVELSSVDYSYSLYFSAFQTCGCCSVMLLGHLLKLGDFLLYSFVYKPLCIYANTFII